MVLRFDTLPRVGMNWKIRLPRTSRFAEAGILQYNFQYIPPLGSVLFQSNTAARFLYVNKTKGGLVQSVTVPDFFWYRYLCLVPNFSGTDSNTFFGAKFFHFRFRYHLKELKIPRNSRDRDVTLWSGWYIGTHTAGAPLLEFYLVFRVLFQFDLI